MKYLKVFKLESEYEDMKGDLKHPTVSLIKDNKKVHFT